jgi:hypothetical protein
MLQLFGLGPKPKIGPPWDFERLLKHIQNMRMTFPCYFCEFSIERQGRLVGGRA